MVTRTDNEYPQRRRSIHDPPPFQNVQGRFDPEDWVSIAIVGAWMFSAYGRGVVHELAPELVTRRIGVVSRRAREIDAEARQATGEAGNLSIAISGSGLDVVYQREHIALANDILREIALVLVPVGQPAKVTPAVLLEPDEEVPFRLFEEEILYVEKVITGGGLETAHLHEVTPGLE